MTERVALGSTPAARRRVAEAEYGNAWPARRVAPFMAAVFFMTIPGLAVVLVLLAALDRFGMWVHSRSGLPWYRDGHRAAPAPGFDELHAVFQSSKRHAIERRRLESVLRDDEHDGAPPHFRDPGEGRHPQEGQDLAGGAETRPGIGRSSPRTISA